MFEIDTMDTVQPILSEVNSRVDTLGTASS